MVKDETELTQIEKTEAWDLAYHCLHWGDPEDRVIEIDQRKLIVLIHNLLNK